jgi:bacteriophage N4 adsorption protein B
LGGPQGQLRTKGKSLTLLAQKGASFLLRLPLTHLAMSASVWFHAWFHSLDTGVAACLFPTALAILISGLDDMALNIVCLWTWMRRGRQAGCDYDYRNIPEKRIAIFVPLWHEHRVIAGMVDHNVSAINYDNYHFFIGAYPNDERTLDVVRELESRYPNVHLAVCPHDGPTSKADCLNWIYQRMLLFEENYGGEFDVCITHDAEDLIHPESFAITNAYADDYDMIQIPVLPLPTPFRKVVHGMYCDEFAEWQLKDMPARAIMGSFVPSNGVGTGFTRGALQKLASAEHNLIFDPACLTEDYENGLRLHKLGCKQVFVPVSRQQGSIVATREYFPLKASSAIRQRTRWLTGIALQSWERHGWRGGFAEVYWFWRDRKGLIGNPISLISNFLFAYGFLTWTAAKVTGSPWGLVQQGVHPALLETTFGIQIVQIIVRMGCVSWLYGKAFALGVPLRTLCGNWINTVATVKAVSAYARARIRHQPLVWLKTEHAYPSRNALVEHKRKLGEILVGSSYIDEAQLAFALRTVPSGMRLGEYLVKRGVLAEEDLYEALSLQQSLPSGRLEPHLVKRNVARTLPLRIMREWKVVPVRISAGSLFLASPEIPTDELSNALRGFTRLEPHFQLVTPGNFLELAEAFL